MRPFILDALVDLAAAPYRGVGRMAWKFLRGKLNGDPAFMGLLEHALIPDKARLLDLGCGSGSLAAWLLAAEMFAAQNTWPETMARPPQSLRIRGIELALKAVTHARAALGSRAEFVCADIRTEAFGMADVVVILDVLHYIDYVAQDAVLERVKTALHGKGRLLLRVGNAAGGWSFKLSQWIDQLVVLARDRRLASLYCRPLSGWIAHLQDMGFSVRPVPMSDGTPFANVLLVADLESNSVSSSVPS
ncbi:MAG TPA: class I SAM-dependent methyltransferase [Rhodocyclaceae bacterium]|nr:class I SAM-dependent methyltransferase [Rhodocyclaceae bacterium]